jgi:hypothetical protein
VTESSLQLQTPRLVLREPTGDDTPALILFRAQRDALYGPEAEESHRVAQLLQGGRVRPDGDRGKPCAHGR